MIELFIGINIGREIKSVNRFIADAVIDDAAHSKTSSNAVWARASVSTNLRSKHFVAIAEWMENRVFPVNERGVAFGGLCCVSSMRQCIRHKQNQIYFNLKRGLYSVDCNLPTNWCLIGGGGGGSGNGSSHGGRNGSDECKQE